MHHPDGCLKRSMLNSRLPECGEIIIKNFVFELFSEFAGEIYFLSFSVNMMPSCGM